jgi:hypothetical protein
MYVSSFFCPTKHLRCLYWDDTQEMIASKQRGGKNIPSNVRSAIIRRLSKKSPHGKANLLTDHEIRGLKFLTRRKKYLLLLKIIGI